MKIAIIGGGPSGVMAAIFALQKSENEIFIFDEKPVLSTLLPTGGGRCNLAYAEFDPKELVKFYPRGEKFLLSVFSRFATGDTIDFFEKIGVKTYIQDDMRVFPLSNSSKEVREKLLSKIKKAKIIKEKVISFSKHENDFLLKTPENSYYFDRIIFAGGIKNNYELLQNAGVDLVEPKPALCALCAEERDLYSLSGVSVKNVFANLPDGKQVDGDILFTHKALSGPLAFKISSLCAYKDFPYKIKLNFVGVGEEEFDNTMLEALDKHSKKDIINIISDLSEFIPRSLVEYILSKSLVPLNLKASQINKKMRFDIVKNLTNFEIKVVSCLQDGEIVTAGGVDLDCINPKTMEYRPISGLYFCGEVLNIDGFTGGFNLQNCWSTGFVAGNSV